MISGIYQIVNKINGYRYFGSSINLEKRLRTHRWQLNKNQHCNLHLQNAWNKHGSDCFLFQIIEIVAEDELIVREQQYLDLGPEYNICPIAGKTKLGTKLSQKTIEKIRASNLGQQRSQETRLKMSLASKGKTKIRSKSHQENLTRALTGLKRTSEICNKIKQAHSFQCIPVFGVHIKTGEKISFPSLNEARLAGFDQGTICKVIAGKRKQHKKYKWYKEVDSYSARF